MPRFSVPVLVVSLSFFVPLAAHSQASDSPEKTRAESDAGPASAANATDQPAAPQAPAIAANAPHMSRETRLQILRDFETQLVYSRTAFPMGAKGLQLRDGVLSPSGKDLQQMLAIYGPSIKPGDPAHISFVQIRGDHIHFELNGGPIRRQKWYQHIQVSGANGPSITGPDNSQTNNPHGSFVDLYFPKYVPEMTAAQLRQLLYPALDFNARTREQAYLDTVPAKVKEAILAHNVLVGMNREMVVYSKGKPPKKVREKDGETEYEEWVYGEPPADVDFVRFVGDEVIRVETMKIDGEKTVRTQKEVVLQPKEDEEEAQKQSGDRPANAPSLRRPGEDQSDVPRPASGASPVPPPPPPDVPQPSGGPSQIVAMQ